ncbi:thioredoxin family protein (plasmid) [Burkholderia thailandensis]|nr:thioredoxin family protein [Burkholderia thailandensis]QRA15383.1 thioredoxin family protein [Burkholderia thailandensis]
MLPSLLIQAPLAVAAGLMLNLTPCVLPAIPIKVRAILHEAGASMAARVLSAALFAAGSVFFFSALGLATALLHLQWGVLFQSRVLLVALSSLLLALALLNFRGKGAPIPTAITSMRGGRFLEPFVSGLVGALLSTPCTGPLLGGVLVFALAQPTANIVIIFVSVGVGLALPYAALILWPGLLKGLPRAGAWSEVIRQSFSWILLGTAFFFVQSLLPGSLQLLLWPTFIAALLLWSAYTFWRIRDRIARRTVAIVSVTAAILVYAGTGFGTSPAVAIDWQRLEAADITRLAVPGKPTLVEFTAAWCINCKILEKTVYRDIEVAHMVQARGVAALQADLTKPDPALEHLLASYGGAGLPFVAILDSQGHEIQHFSGLFASGSLIDALRGIK